MALGQRLCDVTNMRHPALQFTLIERTNCASSSALPVRCHSLSDWRRGRAASLSTHNSHPARKVMKKLTLPHCVLIVLALTGFARVSAQTAAAPNGLPTAQPKLLVITREEVKVGLGAD